MSVPEWEFPVDFNIDEIISLRALEWAESEKIKNQTIGEARAVQELAFRDAILSEKDKKFGKSEKYYWITINPKPGTTLDQVKTLTKKAFSKKWIQAYAYVLENTVNNHIHSHGLIKANYEFARTRKEIGNTVRTICDITNTHCLKVVLIDEELAKQKIAYMMGHKQPSKKENVELTEKWRTENNIEKIYLSTSPLILLDSGGIENFYSPEL